MKASPAPSRGPHENIAGPVAGAGTLTFVPARRGGAGRDKKRDSCHRDLNDTHCF